MFLRSNLAIDFPSPQYTLKAQTETLNTHPILLGTSFFCTRTGSTSSDTNWPPNAGSYSQTISQYKKLYPKFEIESTTDIPFPYEKAVRALVDASLGNNYHMLAAVISSERKHHRFSSTRSKTKYYIKEYFSGVRIIKKMKLSYSDSNIKVAWESKSKLAENLPADQDAATAMLCRHLGKLPSDFKYRGCAIGKKTRFAICSAEGRLFALHIKETSPANAPKKILVQFEIEYDGSDEKCFATDKVSMQAIKQDLLQLRDLIATKLGITPQFTKSSKCRLLKVARPIS